MTIANFVPELWEAAVQVPFEKALVFGQPNVANTKYEGKIQQQGDTVHVTSVADPTIRTYDKTTDIVVEDLADSDTAMLINQGNYYAFRVNDVDKVQAAGDFQNPATQRAGVGLKDAVDKYIAGLYFGGALAANQYGRATVFDGDPSKIVTGTNISAYQLLVKLREKLDNQSVPTVGRYVVVPSQFISALLMDKRYTDLSASGSTDGLLNGQVGRGSGFDVLVSNNIQKVGGAGANKDDLVICAGVPDAVSFANQITETEAIRSEHRFGDLVRGLNIFGAKVFRPEGIATATVSFTTIP